MLDRFDRLGQFARNVWSTPPTPDAPPETPTSDPAVISMLRALGVAMLETGQATNTVGETLDRIAAANGAIEVRAIVLPTVIIIQAAGSRQLIEVEEAHGRRVRLDQAGSVATLVGIAERAEMAPADVVTAVARVRARGPRFGPAVTILGHGVLALGFGLQLRPTPAAVPAYLVLGLLVGTLTVVAVRLPTVATALPVVAAFVVTWVTGSFLADIVDEEPLRVMAPALVSLLPGLTMTIAAVELTSNQIVAGASRIVYGGAQLLLLAFGVVAASQIVGPVPPGDADLSLGWWSPWLGVLVVSVGYVLYSSAPRGSGRWIALTTLVAFGAQTLGGLVLTPSLSGFIGAVVVVPFTRGLARFRSAPPQAVMLIPAFWLLVPGSLGFIGIGEAASISGQAQALATLVNTGLALFAIALGFLVGTGLTHDVRQIHQNWRLTRPVERSEEGSGD